METQETMAVGSCPECGDRHEYLVGVDRQLTDKQENLADGSKKEIIRRRPVQCPKTGGVFQYDFTILEVSGEKILEFRVIELKNQQEETSSSVDPFIVEVLNEYHPVQREAEGTKDILPPISVEDTAPSELSDYLEKQLSLLENYAVSNLRQSRRDRWRFWLLKIPAIVCAAGTSAFELLDIGRLVPIFGIISAACVAIDAAWPGGMLHNLHLRAARETRRLEHEILTEWQKTQLEAGQSPGQLHRKVVELLDLIKKERNRIDTYVTLGEITLGRSER